MGGRGGPLCCPTYPGVNAGNLGSSSQPSRASCVMRLSRRQYLRALPMVYRAPRAMSPVWRYLPPHMVLPSHLAVPPLAHKTVALAVSIY